MIHRRHPEVPERSEGHEGLTAKVRTDLADTLRGSLLMRLAPQGDGETQKRNGHAQ
jgi:hypothetical protein